MHFNDVLTIDHDKGLNCPDYLNLLNDLVLKNIPFVVKGYTKHNKCAEWSSLEYVKNKLGNTSLPVESFDKPFNDITSLSQINMTFEQYVEHIMSHEKPKLYLAELELNSINASEEVKNLNTDVEKVFYDNKLMHRVFLLGRNTITQMHYHRIYDSFIHHVSGPKWTFLYPVENKLFYQLKPYPWYSKLNDWSQILFQSTNHEEFSTKAQELGLKEGYKAFLEPGDSLYVPIYWWHIVFGQDITVSFVDFFHSSWQKKYLSFLGLRSMNHFNLIKKNLV